MTVNNVNSPIGSSSVSPAVPPSVSLSSILDERWLSYEVVKKKATIKSGDTAAIRQLEGVVGSQGAHPIVDRLIEGFNKIFLIKNGIRADDYVSLFSSFGSLAQAQAAIDEVTPVISQLESDLNIAIPGLVDTLKGAQGDLKTLSTSFAAGLPVAAKQAIENFFDPMTMVFPKSAADVTAFFQSVQTLPDTLFNQGLITNLQKNVLTQRINNASSQLNTISGTLVSVIDQANVGPATALIANALNIGGTVLLNATNVVTVGGNLSPLEKGLLKLIYGVTIS